MTDSPITFSGPMIRALLEGRKTQTRRVLKPQPPQDAQFRGIYAPGLSAVFGDPDNPREDDLSIRLHSLKTRLWVREAHRLTDDGESECVIYEADEKDMRDHVEGIKRIQRQFDLSDDWAAPHLRKRPSIHMPRWASRLTLIVTDVRIQRLQDISAEDATGEGVTFEADALAPAEWSISRFADLWNSIHGPDAWDANPWVAAYTFTVHKRNIDEVQP